MSADREALRLAFAGGVRYAAESILALVEADPPDLRAELSVWLALELAHEHNPPPVSQQRAQGALGGAPM